MSVGFGKAWWPHGGWLLPRGSGAGPAWPHMLCPWRRSGTAQGGHGYTLMDGAGSYVIPEDASEALVNFFTSLFLPQLY